MHLCSPGPAGVAAALIARIMELPMVGSLPHGARRLRRAALRRRAAAGAAWTRRSARFYGQCCDVVLSPSASADESLRALGIAPERIGRWDRGVDVTRFDPACASRAPAPGEHQRALRGAADARRRAPTCWPTPSSRARERDPRLHLVLAGGGPEERRAARAARRRTPRSSAGSRARSSPRAYASADIFLFASRTDTFGQVILEAQASGLPVVAVAEGGRPG